MRTDMVRSARRLLAAALGGVAAYGVMLAATPSSGFTGTTIAVGLFDAIDVRNRTIPANHWQSTQRTRGLSDVYVQSNTWEPGGTTGWHTHPGHSLIIVTEGFVTVYDGNDPTCTPEVYSAGMGFVDAGGDHVHMIRNDGLVAARTIAVQTIPAGAARRIDAPASPYCAF